MSGHSATNRQKRIQIMPLYSRYASSEYGMKYALSPNPSYPPFPNDCTSFVSQALFAGGWTMIDGGRKDSSVWWWGLSVWSNASYTWGGAHNFSQFLTT